MKESEVNKITSGIIGAAMDVHRAIGPGLLESSYHKCLCHEFSLRKIPFKTELALPIQYKGMKIETGYRVDLLVSGLVVVELKAVDVLLPIHRAQLLTYLRLGNWPVGLLINFNVPVLKNGIVRLINGSLEK